MKKFTTIKTTVVPLVQNNVDTDQIIPARFLKTTVKTGIGKQLFCDWRYHDDGTENESFILNQANQDGNILLAGDNFGCGSSREHAVWALADYGFRAVMAPSFADIFKQNALNNGLLPIEVSDSFWQHLKDASQSKASVTVDLENQLVQIEGGESTTFQIDSFRKQCILKGYTDLDYLVSIKDDIKAFEKKHPIPTITDYE